MLARASPQEVESANEPKEPLNWAALRRIFRKVGALVGIGLLANMLSASVVAFYALYLVDKHGLEEAHAAMMLPLIHGAGLVAAPMAGALSDRFGRAPLIVGACLVTPVAIGLLTLVPFGALFIIITIVMGASMTARAPVLETMLIDNVPANQRASILGIYFALSMESSSLITPGVGALMDSVGSDETFRGIAVVGLAVTVLVVLAMRLRRRPAEESG
jgi:MFS family permease